MVGKEAPAFTIKDRDGNDVSLADFKGKKVYLNLWASWCGPCKQEIPELEEVYQGLEEKDDLVFLSVVSSAEKEFENARPAEQSKEQIMEVADDLGITYPVLFDTKDQVFKSYQVRAFPTHIFINHDGTIAQKFEGAMTKKELESRLNSLK
ncbi:redoxin domain-containing protein [Streptococcus sp. zg-86]|uniref:Redoxin domain-containing protein n=1 Tax=Streptococcus zhangguiae TaxID=2664091 RepID=A0A6I4RRY1_9STRE|nr:MULTISPECIES: TlpA disulfide reductase family protein [unclassified Streptococcus]MTB64990.1 redoxin domain-containing protein [Streptococcus sp. zg-86]MTB91204.1 redoxin domain-containing protein [Streptococcus sp. zg-36]MWV56925.1 redoxin family protein [Streptococcus sp. zg-70]QTH47165.1 TlpA family protein disulfide reductase [Streptococcus sp. zg-86]